MRISLLQIALSVLCVSMSLAHRSNAQDLLNKKVTLHLSKNEVVDVLEKIEKQAQVNFIYSPEIIDAKRSVSINAEEKALGDLLTELFRPLDISFEVAGKQILLKRRKNALPTKEILPNLSWQMPDIVVTGSIKDENGEALVGVTVQIKGTTKGTTTGPDGTFRLSFPNEQTTLVFSSVGYQKTEILVGKQTALNIVLKSDVGNLDEVVVVGYGSQKKSAISGAVSDVSTKAIASNPSPNLSN